MVEAVRPLVSSSQVSSELLSALRSLLHRAEKSIAKTQQQAVLKLLKFQTIHERFDSIAEAQASTFNWLLDERKSIDPAGDVNADLDVNLTQARERFIDWLERGNGFFYISGKPGAGKSTLMKFIYRHENFARHLALWNPGSELLVGIFFLWKPGHPEQKSMTGLLRGLLCSILESAPFLAAIALPEVCDGFNTGRLGPVVIEHRDVQRAFENILESSADNSTNVMLIIDGLDEFEGEHAGLLALLQSWVSKYPSRIKICVSSREYSVFEEFFAQCPKIRLHELTRNDMSRLIHSRLNPIRFFSSLSKNDKSHIEALISVKAEGVFLWVVMVIATIENGLVSGDITTVRELEGSIKDCPSELEDLFPHLLHTVTIHFRAWAFRAIALVQFSQLEVPELLRSRKSYPGVGLLDLMLLDETSPKWDMCAFHPRSDVKEADIRTRLQVARNKVIGRCNGFLSVTTIPAATTWPANGDERMYAALTHRSVVEFLRTGAARGHMARYLGDFDPLFGLFSTVVACLRFLPPSNYPLLKPKHMWQATGQIGLSDILEASLQERWKEMVICGLSLGKSGSSRFLSLLDAMGDAITRQLAIQLSPQRSRLPPSGNSPHDLLTTITLSHRVYEYSEWRRRQTAVVASAPQMSLNVLKAFQNMIRYFHLDDYHDHKTPGEFASPTQAAKPLDWIRWDWVNHTPSMTLDRFSHLLTELFERGMDLNWAPAEDNGVWEGSRTIEGVPWTCCQMFIWAMLMTEIPYTSKYGEFVDQMIRHGATPDMEIFSLAPTQRLHMKRLTPQDGWILLVPYTRDRGLLEVLMQRGVTDDYETRREYGRMPAALIRDTAPLYQHAKTKGWLITLRDLVALWFPKDLEHFSGLFAAFGQKPPGCQDAGLTPLDHEVEADTGILGTPRGACDMGLYIEEMRVQAGQMDISATIEREVRVA